MAKRGRTDEPLLSALPPLLDAQGLSRRELAKQLDINQSHISRITGAGPPRRVSGELAGRIALHLGLPEDYFPEFREWTVIEAVRRDPALRERLFKQLYTGSRPRRRR